MVQKHYFTIITFLILVLSCNETHRESDTLNIRVVKNDSVVKNATVNKSEKYAILGKYKQTSRIINSQNTLVQGKGKFALGVYEKNAILNKMIVFNNHDTNELNKFIGSDKYSHVFVDEFKSSMNLDYTPKSILISDYINDEFSVENRILEFAFVGRNNDTLGF
ncbi:hypothetical protein ACFQ1Q_00670 [Winogradskyella litorisediminis]|uniref:DM13 domain-containing protein n=1 Tax=Winogradskyella litorisediminis TaxID=1156618 RepID=A0ABW3N346_9FLAO